MILLKSVDIKHTNGQITLHRENISLQTLLCDLSGVSNTNIILRYTGKINLDTVNYINLTLNEILEEICYLFNFKIINKKNKIILISKYQRSFKQYRVNFFFEEFLNVNLAGLSNGKDEKKDNNNESHLWKEIENNIKQLLSNDKDAIYTIDRINGLINIYTTEEKHIDINQYIKVVQEEQNKQVNIKCQIIQISYDDHVHFNISSFIQKIINIFMEKKLVDFFGFLDLIERQAGYTKGIAVNTITEANLTLLNQQSGNISSKERSLYYYENLTKQKNNTIQNKAEHLVDCGYSLSIVPIIQADEKLLLKIRLVISNNINSNNKNILYTITNKELITVLKAQSNEIFIIGYLSEYQERKQTSLLQKILSLFFRYSNKKKSYTFLVLQPNLIQNNKQYKLSDIYDHNQQTLLTIKEIAKIRN